VSDQPANNDPDLEDEAPPAAPPAPPEQDTPAESEPRAAGPVTQRKASSAIAWLALLLVLALGGGAAWLWPQVQQSRTAIDDRLARLEAGAAREQADQVVPADLDALAAEVRQDLQDLRREVQSGQSGLNDTVAAETARLSEALVAVEAQLAQQRAELSRFEANDRSSWLIAEAEYLLRLANQRLIMAGDTVAARALLSSADSVLKEIDDIGLHDVRAAVAADLAAVRAVPAIDVQGIYLRLAALIEQADALVIFAMPDREGPARAEPADDWQDRLRQGYEEALQKLSDYLVIRRRDEPMQALMDPQWEGLVRQNLRMLLEQAQVALLSGNQTLYVESLERAGHWVTQFDESDPAAASAMKREISLLASERVAVDMPDITRSLRALDSAVEARLNRRQGGTG